MYEGKIKPEHLQRKAYVYIRQSSLRQVVEHSESTKRQYDLKGRAMAMGWAPEHIVVIDEDLGLSGSGTRWLDGFQYLLSEVGMAKAGAVLALEVSRLARNSSDWHRLLEICAMTETLIVDEDGIYDPRHFNDRFLLGMKGQMSEAELHILKARLQGGSLNKARRGALQLSLPVGLCYSASGEIVLDSDREVQEAIKRVFDVFAQKGSAGMVVRYFSENSLLFPHRIKAGVNKGSLYWRPLLHSCLLKVLHNPRYTGAYIFGRMRVSKNVLTGKTIAIKLPQDRWQVFIPAHGQGYITWEEYEANQRRLRANALAFGADRRAGPPREGTALLQGIIICSKCGKRMTLRYHARKGELVPDYVCQREGIETNTRACQLIPGRSIDKAVEKLLLEKLTPESIEVALDVFEEVKQRQEDIKKAHRMRIAKLQYEADLAGRQYMNVDPANRLVACTLEKNWNDKLMQLQIATDEYDRKYKNSPLLLNPEIRDQLLGLLKDFSRVWHNPKTPLRDKKRIVRLMIQDVTLMKDKAITIKIRWKGGAHTIMEIPKPLPAPLERMTPEGAVNRIKQLSTNYTAKQIADILNREGYATGTHQKFSSRSLQHIMSAYGIKSYYGHLREQGKLTTTEIAKMLGVCTTTVIDWHRAGLLNGRVASDKGEYLFALPIGNLPPKRPGEKLYVRKKKVENFVHAPHRV
jgi:DNA invertase Pin-like site-specific DNA recombinase/DNA-binding transcriptional regulator YiaG